MESREERKKFPPSVQADSWDADHVEPIFCTYMKLSTYIDCHPRSHQRLRSYDELVDFERLKNKTSKLKKSFTNEN